MDDPACRSHPLYTAALQKADIAHMVFMTHTAFKHVGHRFEAPVRVRWKAGDVVIRLVRSELVQHQKRIELLHATPAEDTRQFDARAIGRWLTRLNGQDFTKLSHGREGTPYQVIRSVMVYLFIR